VTVMPGWTCVEDRLPKVGQRVSIESGEIGQNVAIDGVVDVVYMGDQWGPTWSTISGGCVIHGADWWRPIDKPESGKAGAPAGQYEVLLELIGLLARRVDILEARPIVGIGPNSPRVYDGPLIQKFDDLYAKGEAADERGLQKVACRNGRGVRGWAVHQAGEVHRSELAYRVP